MKLMHIVGARPQFIKYFPIQQAIEKASLEHSIENRLLHTGQHYDYLMSKIFFDELGIREPDYHLEVGSGTHGKQTATVLQKVEEVLLRETPDLVVVYGDTNSTLGGALAATKIHIPVAHVEAGLRSFNKHMPEEINRVLTDHVSTFLFCPSQTAVKNLEAEGFAAGTPDRSKQPDIDHCVVIRSGDVMYDMLLHSLKIARQKSRILEQLGLQEKEYSVLTLHRAENTDQPSSLEEIIQFVNDTTAGQPVIFPMHPRMVGAYEKSSGKFGPHVRIIKPLGYFDLLLLLKHSSRLFTDSGGMQKEAYWTRVPCVTLRKETEWVETIQSGWNTLYADYPNPRPIQTKIDSYGDGNAAELIISTLWSFFSHG